MNTINLTDEQTETLITLIQSIQLQYVLGEEADNVLTAILEQLPMVAADETEL
jgi:hypothetical protein